MADSHYNRILSALLDLGDDDFETVKFYLSRNEVVGGIPCIPWSRLQKSKRPETAHILCNHFSTDAIAATSRALDENNQKELAERLRRFKEEDMRY